MASKFNMYKNFEQLEASQRDADADRNEYNKGINTTELSNMEYVEGVMGELAKRGIPCYLYMTPSLDNLECFQYNTVSTLFKSELDGGDMIGKGLSEIHFRLIMGMITVLYSMSLANKVEMFHMIESFIARYRNGR
jgi:hypothetical protein